MNIFYAIELQQKREIVSLKSIKKRENISLKNAKKRETLVDFFQFLDYT